MTQPLVEVDNLSFRYPHSREPGLILDSLNLTVHAGTTLGIVGESGSGKSTLVRILCGLLTAPSGSVTYDGRDINDLLRTNPRQFHRDNQIVFQSPASSLDPRMRIRQSVAEPVKALERRRPGNDELEQWLALVGLGPDIMGRYPHQLSGGQLQRVALARALSVNPTILYADEPTSALDVSVQAQVLNLLVDLRRRLGLTLVMVSHDLAIVDRICENIIIMRNGLIEETGRTASILQEPASPYTAALVRAARAVSLASQRVT